jgi:DNA polymerase I
LCLALAETGLPIDVAEAERIVAASVGPRPRTEGEALEFMQRRDELVLRHAPLPIDLRNPLQVRRMLTDIGLDVPDTRAHRLEQYRHTHPVVDALLTWRKAERMATTYGYRWIDEHITDGRLRGAWSPVDGAAGRMTAQAGLHNLPAELRSAVVAEPGMVFVHTDLGQIEPRVLAAVSGDRALIAATQADDLYAPVAAALGVERPVAKVAILAAMYGGTVGSAADALRSMRRAYPVAMQLLDDADADGRAGFDVRTIGGRLIRMWHSPEDGRDSVEARRIAAARGRYARNALIQGAAAELFKAWAVTLRAQLSPDTRIVLCLHDELIIHAPADSAESVRELVESTLQESTRRWSPTPGVRFVTTARVIHRWSDAK